MPKAHRLLHTLENPIQPPSAMPIFDLPQHTPITVVHRGGHPELVHHGSVAVCNARGDVLASAGDVWSPMFTRSALKPFQAMPLVARFAERYQLTDADVALLCASHNGEPAHTQGVATLLAKAGADDSALACGSNDFDATVRLIADTWRNFRANQVYRADHLSMLRSGAKWMTLLSAGWLLAKWR